MAINLLTNKNSLFFNISLYFIVLIITAHLIVYIGYNITKQQQIDLLISRYMKTVHQVENNFFSKYRSSTPNIPKKKFHHPLPQNFSNINLLDFNSKLSNFDMSIAKIDYQEIKKNGNRLAKDMDWELYEYKKHNYFYRQTPFSSLLIKDNLLITEKTKYIILLTILFNVLFISFYVFLIKKLKPLYVLKENIIKFSKGDLDINTSCIGKDEISEVSNEFDNAINQIKALRESRNLFLRNIMHELKTPITKGVLISNMMNKSKQKESLQKLFFRLEYLLEEFAKIEKFTSKSIPLNKKEYRIVDIIDEALDLLLLDSNDVNIDVNHNTKINVDFEMFALVFKNLIDNAIKHGYDTPHITIQKEYIRISNMGKKLPEAFKNYNKPFNRKYESTEKGLGLGLYIVKSIIKAHNLTLTYTYDKNINNFTIYY